MSCSIQEMLDGSHSLGGHWEKPMSRPSSSAVAGSVRASSMSQILFSLRCGSQRYLPFLAGEYHRRHRRLKSKLGVPCSNPNLCDFQVFLVDGYPWVEKIVKSILI